MRTRIPHTLLLAAMIAVLWTASAAADPQLKPVSSHDKARFVAGEALVVMKSGVTASARASVAAAADARIDRLVPRSWVKDGTKLVVVRSATLSTQKLVKQLRADPRVEFAEPNYIVRADTTPNDALFSQLWGMTQISAPAAWDVTRGSTSIVVADIDSGVDYNHEDLAANMWHNPLDPIDGTDNDGNGYVDDYYGINQATVFGDEPSGDPMDDHGHGTHTSGTAAAVGNNSLGVTGVAWNVKIMALRFLAYDADTGGASGDTADAIACIDYMVHQKTAHGVNVVVANNSWGGGEYDSELEDAINAAGTAGIVFVASAGNDSSDNDAEAAYPASYTCSNIVSVAATDKFDALASFSNWGATSVDLAAPGVSIRSTIPPSLYSGTKYGSMSGTSMAAPHVTGAIALCAAQFPSDTVAQRIARVLNTVDPIASLAGKCVTGGRLDVSKAVGGVAPADDDVPGIPLQKSAVPGSLNDSTDRDDVYRVDLTAESTITASINGPAGSNFDLFLFGPGTTTVAGHSAAVASATGGSYPDSFSFTVATGGTYYLDAYAVNGSGEYSITYTIVSDDEIPGRPIPASPISNTLNRDSDRFDCFAIHLDFGQVIQASISGAAGTDFWVLLYDPTAEDFSTYLEGGTSGGYPRSFTYQAWKSGTYYLVAYAAAGTGTYTMQYSTSMAPDDQIPGVPLTGSPVTGSLAAGTDWQDIYSFSAAAGQRIQMSLTGQAGTDFDLYLLPAGYPSAEDLSGYLVRAYTDSYPEAFAYTVPTSGVYYVVVNQYDGSGSYTLTHNIPADSSPPTTTIAGVPAGWTKTNVTVTLSATDGISGVRTIEYQLAGGAWTAYTSPVVISTEGQTTVSYRSTDNAGNVEAAKSATVSIDKTGATTSALRKVVTKKGKKAVFSFKVTDRTPTAKVTIKIFKRKALKKVIAVGSKQTGNAQTYTWKKCTLPTGSYTWKVYAVDEAGNQQKVIGSKAFVVK